MKKSFEKVAVKPGKPVWFGTMGDNYVARSTGQPRIGPRHSSCVFETISHGAQRQCKACQSVYYRPALPSI